MQEKKTLEAYKQSKEPKNSYNWAQLVLTRRHSLTHTTEMLNQTFQAIDSYSWFQKGSIYSTALGLRSELEVFGKQASGGLWWAILFWVLGWGFFCWFGFLFFGEVFLQAWEYLRAVFLAISFSGDTDI